MRGLPIRCAADVFALVSLFTTCIAASNSSLRIARSMPADTRVAQFPSHQKLCITDLGAPHVIYIETEPKEPQLKRGHCASQVVAMHHVCRGRSEQNRTSNANGGCCRLILRASWRDGGNTDASGDYPNDFLMPGSTHKKPIPRVCSHPPPGLFGPAAEAS